MSKCRPEFDRPWSSVNVLAAQAGRKRHAAERAREKLAQLEAEADELAELHATAKAEYEAAKALIQ